MGCRISQFSEAIFGTRHRSTQVNGECRYLDNRGLIVRKKQVDEPIRNCLARLKPHLELVRAGHNLRGELITFVATFKSPAACDVILWIVHHRPGITEGDLSEALYGERDQSRVHQDCDILRVTRMHQA